jgi:maleate isomerase
MRQAPIRIGMIVPSSNVTVEAELPGILANNLPLSSFHSSRMRMTQVSDEGLALMNSARERCVTEITDVGPDAIVYGCLVALMAQGRGEHRRVEDAIHQQLISAGRDVPVITSAGALVETLLQLQFTKVGLVMPYMLPLARKVVHYLEEEGIEIVDWTALEIEDNAKVAEIHGEQILDAASGLDLTEANALVISACVQMPSLSILDRAADEFGIPVLSAATATSLALVRALGLSVDTECIPGLSSVGAPLEQAGQGD